MIISENKLISIIRKIIIEARASVRHTGKSLSHLDKFNLEEMSREKLPNGAPKYYFNMSNVRPGDDQENTTTTINLGPSYKTTPLGLYVYPLNEEFYSRLKYSNLPYMNNAKFCTVLTPRKLDKFLYIEKGATEKNIYKKIKSNIIKIEDQDSELEGDYKSSFIKDPASGREIKYAPQGIRKLRKELLKSGYDFIYDAGNSFIHVNEPDQGVFLNPNSYRIVEKFLTKEIRKQDERKSLEKFKGMKKYSIQSKPIFKDILTKHQTYLNTGGRFGEKADLSNKVLTNLKLKNFNLSGMNLSGAKLSGSYLVKTNFDGANLSDVDLSGSHIENIWLDGSQTKLSGLDLSNCYLKNVTIHNADIKKIIINKTIFNDVRFYNVNFSMDKFNDMEFISCKFEKCNFIGSEFVGSDLRSSKFNYCKMNGVDFTNANLSSAEFKTVGLSGAIFRLSKLTGAKFNYTSLVSADFSGSEVEGINFGENQENENNFITKSTIGIPKNIIKKFKIKIQDEMPQFYANAIVSR